MSFLYTKVYQNAWFIQSFEFNVQKLQKAGLGYATRSSNVTSSESMQVIVLKRE